MFGISPVATSFFARYAYTDNVSIPAVTHLTDPSYRQIQSSGSAAFGGTRRIVFPPAGGTGTWVGSASATGPKRRN